MSDLLIIIGLTLASCIAVGLIGLALLHVLRYRSLRQQLTIATLLPVVAVATTVLINVQLMFLSPHDSLVILIALLTALLLAAVLALLPAACGPERDPVSTDVQARPAATQPAG